MTKKLKDVRIAILLCDGFEEVEMTKPRSELKKQGAIVHLITPGASKVKACKHGTWTKEYNVDIELEEADPKDYEILILPGGVMNPDTLRTHKKAIQFINYFLVKKKILAAICHGPWSIIETKKLKNRKMTSYPSIKTDLINAGAKWTNKPVVIDKNLITSRNPNDLPVFCKAIMKEFLR